MFWFTANVSQSAKCKLETLLGMKYLCVKINKKIDFLLVVGCGWFGASLYLHQQTGKAYTNFTANNVFNRVLQMFL